MTIVAASLLSATLALAGAPPGPVGDEVIAKAEESLLTRVGLLANKSSMQDPWEAFTAALQEEIDPRNELPQLQMLSSPMRAEWNDAEHGNYIAWRVLGDSKPKWTYIYDTSGVSVSDSYELFLRNIAIPSVTPEASREIEKLERQMRREIREYNHEFDRHLKEWDRFNTKQQRYLPPSRWRTYDEWLALTFQGVLDSARDRIRIATQNYRAYVNKVNPNFTPADALAKYYDEQYQKRAKAPDNTNVAYRTYNITPSLDKFIREAKAGQAQQRSFTITKSSVRRSVDQSRWRAGGSISFGFFSIGGSGGRQSINVESTSDRFHLTFRCKGMETFTITPGGWFDGAVVQTYRNGPWVNGGPIDQQRVALWGPNGVFNLMAAKVVVVYQPEISIRLSQLEFEKARTAYGGGGGISIGPFSFGGGGGGASTDVQFDASSHTVTVRDKSERPQIAAIISNRLPMFD